MICGSKARVVLRNVGGPRGGHSATGSQSREARRLKTTRMRGPGRSRGQVRACGCRKVSTRWGHSANSDRVVETASHRALSERFTESSGHVVPDDRQGRWRMARSGRAGVPRRQRMPSPGVPSSVSIILPLAARTSTRLSTLSANIGGTTLSGQSNGRGTSGGCNPGAFELELALAERCVDGEDLAPM